MTRVVLTGIALAALLALTGCAQAQSGPLDSVEQEVVESEVDDSSGAIAYEFEPYSTLDQVTGWPSTALSAQYFVSVPIEMECHWPEASSLMGPDIAGTISLETTVTLEALACAITPTPASDRDDVIDEVAWRVDEGASTLVAAYAQTVFPDGTLDCEPVEVPPLSPGLSVKHLDSWYVVRPAALACADTVALIEQGVAALRLTEVLRHTTTFDDYVARGF